MMSTEISTQPSCAPPPPRGKQLRQRVRSPRFRSLRVRSRMSFVAVAFLALLAASMWSEHPREIYEAEEAVALLASSSPSSAAAARVLPSRRASGPGSLLADLSLFDYLDGPGCAAESRLQRYGLFIWISLGIYLFVAIALVCDEYFEESLTCISERLQLSEDVAGATFMAAGSSAPELFVALIGVMFYPDDNPGPGTIIGSAAFNMCIIVALSCILASKPLRLTRWAIYRDCTWYLVSLGFLLLVESVISPAQAEWWEALMMLLMYVLYCVSMSYNQRMKALFGFDKSAEVKAAAMKENLLDGDALKGSMDLDLDHAASASSLAMSSDPDAIPMTATNSLKKNSDSFIVVDGNDDDHSINSGAVAVSVSSTLASPGTPRGSTSGDTVGDEASAATEPKSAGTDIDSSDEGDSNEDDEEEEEKTFMGQVWKVVTYPWSLMFKLTIPNCEEDSRFREWYWMTFAMSIVWLGILSFFMVDTFTKISCCLGIPAHFTGLTLIALGTSVPDATASVVVAKDGFGDMAVSNAVGSNLMNILCGLPFSWLLGSIFSQKPTKLLDSEHIWVFVVALVFVVAVYLACIVYNNFVIAKRTGWTLVATYVAFITFIILYEIFIAGVGTEGGC